MQNKVFFGIVGFYFAIFGVFHFVRLAFGWEIIVENYSVPTLTSGIYFIFGIFMIYLSYKNIKGKTEKEEGPLLKEEE